MTNADYSLPLIPNLEDFWRLESIGIQESPTESDDIKALNRFNETLSFENGRYSVTWPWKKGETRPARESWISTRATKVPHQQNEKKS